MYNNKNSCYVSENRKFLLCISVIILFVIGIGLISQNRVLEKSKTMACEDKHLLKGITLDSYEKKKDFNALFFVFIGVGSGGGTTKQSNYYAYIQDRNGGYVLVKLTLDQVSIYEDEKEAPYVTGLKKDYWRSYDGSLFGTCNPMRFHIPLDSISPIIDIQLENLKTI